MGYVAHQRRERWSVAVLLLLVRCCLANAQDAAAAEPGPQGLQPQLLEVPEGFEIKVWRTGLPKARQMAAVQVNGSTIVYVGSVSPGKEKPLSDVYYIVDSNSDGTPDYSGSLLKDIDTPNGVAVQGSDLYVPGFQNGKGMIWRLRDVHTYALQNKTFTGRREVVTDRLPGDPWHGRRFLRFSPDGLLVLGIGEPCNVCPPRKTENGIWFGSLYALNVTSGRLQQLAAGVRNSAGFDFHPRTDELYFTDNGRDQMGDDSPDCELNRLPPRSRRVNLAINGVPAYQGLGAVPNFGFPYCQTQGLGNPYQRDLGGGRPVADPDLNENNAVVNCSAPNAYLQAFQAMGPHTAPIGMRFYRWRNTTRAFPRSYDNAMFIVQRGSWNRKFKIGYRVMLLKLDSANQRPRVFEEFARGWLQNVNTPQNYEWGRPNDVEQLPDGSLLISDDHQDNGVIYRITYTGANRASSASSATEAAARTTTPDGGLQMLDAVQNGSDTTEQLITNTTTEESQTSSTVDKTASVWVLLAVACMAMVTLLMY